MTARAGLVEPGTAHPLGASVVPGGVNLCVYAKRATGMDVLLFDGPDDLVPGRVINLDPHINRTGEYWHALVPSLGPGQLYAFAAHGPWAPERGERFDPTRVLLDPYGRGVVLPDGYRRVPAGVADPTAVPMKSVVVDTSLYDWEGDEPICRPWRETVVYEAHLRGMTADPASGVAAGRRGTYAGFVEKIPYLVELGITAVELLPVFQFDPLAAPAGLVNYWGYQPVSFFAPHAGYASRPGPTAAVDEFRDMVKACHRAGLEVILDVVYNHTAEVGADGPTFSFRGLANDDYYLLDADDPARYEDFSGTGNTLNANGPIVRRLILDSLRYWVEEMHVDGFRFDLAAILSRGEDGEPLTDPPVLWEIETDPVLAGTKLIAEAWDAGGLYQVGSFVGDRWVEWNGRFRDDVRAFVKSDPGMVPVIMDRLLGSVDLYGHKHRDAQASINFVTCHDGFTLEDLVSYDRKHNEANGEGDRDGNDQNLSWNCGVEGPTTDPDIERLRGRQVRNFLAIEMLSLGVPMLLMGDEVRRTQGGNNNDYCHDDATAWFDWTGPDRHADVLRFTRDLIRLRRRLSELMEVPDGTSLLDLLRGASTDWSGVTLGEPDLGESSRSIALTIRAPVGALHLILNAYWEPLDFTIPVTDAGTGGWRRIIDTGRPSPDDIALDFGAAAAVDTPTVRAGGRSLVLLASRRDALSTGPKGAR
ncbi:MAG TPA: glycogen debranching protein GlgX [Candidatus Limnocylindrales bacterium]|nr:glycogen debranching protein GlgX [Candidatus Limnocylindrales bacterium]